MKTKFSGVVACCMTLLGASPVAADAIVYGIAPLQVWGDFYVGSLDSGYVKTDGTIGVLQPENILSWEITETL